MPFCHPTNGVEALKRKSIAFPALAHPISPEVFQPCFIPLKAFGYITGGLLILSPDF